MPARACGVNTKPPMSASSAIMIGPPMNSREPRTASPSTRRARCRARRTRFVDANMKTIAEMKSAPFWNSDFAIAVAAYEQLDDTIPKPDARATDRGPVVAQHALHAVACDTNACTAPDSVKPRISAHSVSQNMKNASRRLIAEVAQRDEGDQLHRPRSRTTSGRGGRPRRTPRRSCPAPSRRPRRWRRRRSELRCASSSSSATACSAFVAAEIWVSTSMQYASSSTMRCRPRTWPSIRRNRRCTSPFWSLYPAMRSSTWSCTLPPQGIGPAIGRQTPLRAGAPAGRMAR